MLNTCVFPRNLIRFLKIKIDNLSTYLSHISALNGAAEIAKYLLKKNGKYTMFDLMMW